MTFCKNLVYNFSNNRVSTNGTYESDVNQSLALGGITDGVTNVELTAAYAAIANQGTYNTPVLYTTVKDSNGNVLLSNKKKSRKVIKKSTAWLLTNAMEDVVKKGTGRAAQLDSDMLLPPKQVLLLTTMTTGSADIRHTTRHLSGQVMTITLLLIMMKITIK